ncbi:MAG: hypothetical protein Q8O30_00900 [Candidatus Omnitrophota bacterium]|nr:hypothetical protein [Candidatus Omnitrophota bacterium]
MIQSLFPFIIFIAFLAIFYISGRKKNEALKNLTNHFNGSIVKFTLYPTLNGEYHGLNFSIKLIPASKSSPAYLKISLAKSSFFKLSIYREGFLSNLGKKLGIVHEVKINDESLDRDFLIFSNNPTQAMSHLNNGTIKNTIRELFDNGFDYIIASGKTIIIQKPNYILEKDLDITFITGILQKLILFSKGW